MAILFRIGDAMDEFALNSTNVDYYNDQPIVSVSIIVLQNSLLDKRDVGQIKSRLCKLISISRLLPFPGLTTDKYRWPQWPQHESRGHHSILGITTLSTLK